MRLFVPLLCNTEAVDKYFLNNCKGLFTTSMTGLECIGVSSATYARNGGRPDETSHSLLKCRQFKARFHPASSRFLLGPQHVFWC